MFKNVKKDNLFINVHVLSIKLKRKKREMKKGYVTLNVKH